jgi:hypothetical protein
MRKDFIAREAVHHPQLNDVQSMVKRAGQHRRARARLLVKGPEPKIVVLEIATQSLDSSRKQIFG